LYSWMRPTVNPYSCGEDRRLPSHIVQCEKTHRFTGARRQGIGK